MQKLGRWMAKNPTPILLSMLFVLFTSSAFVISSLITTVESEQQATMKVEALGALTSYVSDAGRDIDRGGQRLQMLTEGLAAELQTLLLSAPPSSNSSSSSNSSRLTGSFRHASVHLSKQGDAVAMLAQQKKLAPLHDRFRTIFLRALTSKTFPQSLEEQLLFLSSEKSVLQSAYLGLESGLELRYPGLDTLSDHEDPRTQRWYQDSAQQSQLNPQFGLPYTNKDEDGSTVVPCNAPVRDAQGQLLGVVGTNIRLDLLTDVIQMDQPRERIGRKHARPPLQGWRRSQLFSKDHHLIASAMPSTLAAQPPNEDPRVREFISAEKSNGVLFSTDRITVIRLLNAIGWYLVVEVEREA